MAWKLDDYTNSESWEFFIGSNDADTIVGQSSSVYLGLEGDDVFIAGNTLDPQIFIGGAGSDSYSINNTGLMVIKDSDNGSPDEVNSSGIGISYSTSFSLMIDSQHLVVGDINSQQEIWIINWLDGDLDAATLNLADGSYTAKYVIENITNFSNYLGDFTWAEIQDIYAQQDLDFMSDPASAITNIEQWVVDETNEAINVGPLEGTYTFSDGSVYEGTFVDGLFNGQGTMTYADGTSYEGSWLDGDRNGQGTYTFADGSVYEGTFVDDLFNGQGTMTYTNGTSYEGAFVDNQFIINDSFNSQGTIQNIYLGEFTSLSINSSSIIQQIKNYPIIEARGNNEISLHSELEGSNYLIKLYGDGSHEKTTFTIQSSASIVGTGTIINLSGTSFHEIYNYGDVSGGYLIENNGSSFHFENSGNLVSNRDAFHLNVGWDENPISIENHGSLSATTGAWVYASYQDTSHPVEIINSGEFTVTGTLFTAAGDNKYASFEIQNSGLLSSGGIALDAALIGTDSIENSGKIFGDIFFYYGDDSLISSSKSELIGTVYGGFGNDFISGGLSHDQFYGEDNNDTLYGGAGNDKLYGGNDNDTLQGDDGKDLLNGGAGIDTVVFTGAKRTTVDLNKKGFQNTGHGRDKIIAVENVTSGDGNDVLKGNRAANELTGNGGNDKLYGNGGNDKLYGGTGADSLNGGLGKDIMYAGVDKKSDVFIFNSTDETGKTARSRDQIVQFDSGEDYIDLSGIDADTNQSGDQAFDYFGKQGKNFSEENATWYYKAGKNVVVRGDVDGDGKFDFEIQVNRMKVLVEDDFLL